MSIKLQFHEGTHLMKKLFNRKLTGIFLTKNQFKILKIPINVSFTEV